MASIEPTIAEEPGHVYYIPQPLPAAELSRLYHTSCGKTVIWYGERELPGIGFVVDALLDPNDLDSDLKGEVCGYSISTIDAPKVGLVWILNVLVFRYGQGFQEHDRLRAFRSEDEQEIRRNRIEECDGEKLRGFPKPSWAASQIRKGQIWKCRLLPPIDVKLKPAPKTAPRKRKTGTSPKRQTETRVTIHFDSDTGQSGLSLDVSQPVQNEPTDSTDAGPKVDG